MQYSIADISYYISELPWMPFNSLAPGKFSAANLALAGFPLANALGESMPSRH